MLAIAASSGQAMNLSPQLIFASSCGRRDHCPQRSQIVESNFSAHPDPVNSLCRDGWHRAPTNSQADIQWFSYTATPSVRHRRSASRRYRVVPHGHRSGAGWTNRSFHIPEEIERALLSTSYFLGNAMNERNGGNSRGSCHRSCSFLRDSREIPMIRISP